MFLFIGYFSLANSTSLRSWIFNNCSFHLFCSFYLLRVYQKLFFIWAPGYARSRISTYDDVVGRIARQLELDDPSKIRLASHNCYSQQPKPEPIKYRGVDNLVDMLVHYYEVVIHTIRLPKRSTVIYVISNLKTKIFPITEKKENINDQYWILRAEEIPEEKKNLGPHDGLVHAYRSNKEAAQNQTWKFAFLLIGRPEYLEDLDILLSRFQQRDVCGAWEQYLGLDHSDGAPKRTHAEHQETSFDHHI